MRLIDADALLDRIPNLYERREVSRWVDKAKTVDAVEVVRCRDCKRWDKYHNEQIGECKWTFQVTKAEGYCNYGEWKGGDRHDGS